MKKVLIGALAALTLAAAAGAVACSDGGEKQPYEYPYELITNLEIDEGMNIDGVLDEDVYAGNRYMQYSLSNTNVRLTTHFGEKGLYVGCVIKDNYIYHNKPYLMDANSSMYLYIVPTDVIKKRHADAADRGRHSKHLERQLRSFRCGDDSAGRRCQHGQQRGDDARIFCAMAGTRAG